MGSSLNNPLGANAWFAFVKDSSLIENSNPTLFEPKENKHEKDDLHPVVCRNGERLRNR